MGLHWLPDELTFLYKVRCADKGAVKLTRHVNISCLIAASFSPDGTRVVTASRDNTAKVWDAKTGSPVLTLQGHTEDVTSASFSADGTRVITGSKDGSVKIWDSRSNAETNLMPSEA